MKKYLILNIMLLLVLLLMIGCKTTQPIVENHQEKTINYDSIFLSKKLERNKAIIDSLTIALGKPKTGNPNCDSLCNIALNDVLSRLNIKKQSGDNSYSVRYDPATNTLFINAKIGETQNSSKQSYRYITKTITLVKTKEIPIDKPLPKWQIILMLIGTTTIVYFLYKMLTFIKPKFSFLNRT